MGSSLLKSAGKREGERPRLPVREHLFDPQNRKSLEQPCAAQRTGISGFKAKRIDEAKHDLLGVCVVAGTNITGLIAWCVGSAIVSYPVWCRVLKTCAPWHQSRMCSAAEEAKPSAWVGPSGPCETGFVQSMMILPATGPSERQAASAACQGTASTITSAPRAASPGCEIASLPRPAYWPLVGSGTP